MEKNLIQDLSILTQIKLSLITKLSTISESILCDYINEAQLKDTDILDVNIGIGKIGVLINDDEIEYSFKPSPKLEKGLVSTVLDNKNPLVKNLEDSLESKMMKAYKEFM